MKEAAGNGGFLFFDFIFSMRRTPSTERVDDHFDLDHDATAAVALASSVGKRASAIMPTARQTQLSDLHEMMERLGLDPAEGVLPHFSLSYATAAHRCAGCPSKQACRAWLDRMPAAATFAPPFCPNADIFFELHFDLVGRAHRAGAPASSENRKAD